MTQYSHLFFDLDHTLWDFETNSRITLEELYVSLQLRDRGIGDFDEFHRRYLVHNDKLWERYRNGFIKVDELRWKRMWLTLLDFKIADEPLARSMGVRFLEALPTRKTLFPYTLEILQYLTGKGYRLHLITNGFEATQHSKLQYAGIGGYFGAVITSEGSGSLKPHKEIFDYALRVTGAAPEESIMLGDSIEVDIQGAKDAGIDQVYVNHLRTSPDGAVGDGSPDRADNKDMRESGYFISKTDSRIMQPTYMVYSLKELEEIF
jgi:putative hydrolase of the HAD superfamily